LLLGFSVNLFHLFEDASNLDLDLLYHFIPLVTCDQLSELLVLSVAAGPHDIGNFRAIFVRDWPILPNFVTFCPMDLSPGWDAGQA
jgi:hypothetical protein